MSPDIDRPELPADPTDCYIGVEVEIGPAGEDGAEIFQFDVATPSGLVGIDQRWGRGLLIVDEFSWGKIDRTLERLLMHCVKGTWHEIASELNKELHWEFENYQEWGGE